MDEGDGVHATRKALLKAAGGPRDPYELRSVIEPWLSDRIGTHVTVGQIRTPVGAGIANETLLVDIVSAGASGSIPTGVVIRIEPDAIRLFPDTKVRTLGNLLNALDQSGAVKVPRVFWIEDDPALLGAPFMAMQMVEGRAPASQPPYTSSGWLKDASPEQRRLVWRTGVQGLASIARVPAGIVPMVDRPEYGATGEDQELGFWEAYAEWIDCALPDKIVELGEAVRRYRPNELGKFLTWGDARIGNMMFGDDFRLAAVLDWDQMSHAPPRHDLAWWLYFEDHYSIGEGNPRLEGMGSRADTIALWEECTGQSAGNLEWYHAFAMWKLSLVSIKVAVASGHPLQAMEPLLARFLPGARAAIGLTP